MGGLGVILVGTGMRLVCLNKRVNAPVGGRLRPAAPASLISGSYKVNKGAKELRDFEEV
jgi:hypothetical protein